MRVFVAAERQYSECQPKSNLRQSDVTIVRTPISHAPVTLNRPAHDSAISSATSRSCAWARRASAPAMRRASCCATAPTRSVTARIVCKSRDLRKGRTLRPGRIAEPDHAPTMLSRLKTTPQGINTRIPSQSALAAGNPPSALDQPIDTGASGWFNRSRDRHMCNRGAACFECYTKGDRPEAVPLRVWG